MTATVLESLNHGIHEAMSSDDRVILLGEDILDPYGGAFKVTKGCYTAFPDRVIAAPISEAGLAGVVTGMAMRGLRPVLEVMFGDFTALMADQVINHMSKFRWMYNNTVQVPLVIRTPMGGRRGYGPTHSQTLEKHFLGVPGLTVLAPTNITDGNPAAAPGKLLEHLILTIEGPVLFVENKLQYLLPIYTPQDLPDLEITGLGQEPGSFPGFRVRVKGAPVPAVTLAAYGYMAELGRQALQQLAFEEEIFTELIILTHLSPFNIQNVLQSVLQTRNLVVLEESTRTLGWGAEVITRVVENDPQVLLSVSRVTALDLPVPAAPALEQSVLPLVEDIKAAVRKAVTRK